MAEIYVYPPIRKYFNMFYASVKPAIRKGNTASFTLSYLSSCAEWLSRGLSCSFATKKVSLSPCSHSTLYAQLAWIQLTECIHCFQIYTVATESVSSFPLKRTVSLEMARHLLAVYKVASSRNSVQLNHFRLTEYNSF